MTQYSALSRKHRRLGQNPALWRGISLQEIHQRDDHFNPFEPEHLIANMLQRSCQLRVLSLRYCQHVTQDTMTIIADNCNPFFLKELYLDGCENVNDMALINLVKPRTRGPFLEPDQGTYRFSELLSDNQLS